MYDRIITDRPVDLLAGLDDKPARPSLKSKRKLLRCVKHLSIEYSDIESDVNLEGMRGLWTNKHQGLGWENWTYPNPYARPYAFVGDLLEFFETVNNVSFRREDCYRAGLAAFGVFEPKATFEPIFRLDSLSFCSILPPPRDKWEGILVASSSSGDWSIRHSLGQHMLDVRLAAQRSIHLMGPKHFCQRQHAPNMRCPLYFDTSIDLNEGAVETVTSHMMDPGLVLFAGRCKVIWRHELAIEVPEGGSSLDEMMEDQEGVGYKFLNSDTSLDSFGDKPFDLVIHPQFHESIGEDEMKERITAINDYLKQEWDDYEMEGSPEIKTSVSSAKTAPPCPACGS